MVGRVFRRAFELCRNPAYLVPAFLTVAAMTLLGWLVARPPAQPAGMSWPLFVSMAGRVAIAFSIGILAIWPSGTLMALAIGLLRGEDATFANRWIRFGLYLRLLLVEAVAGIVIFLGLLLLLAPGLYVLVVWSQIRAVMVDGRASFFDALEASQDLTRGSRGDVFAMALCILLASGVGLGVIELIRLASGAAIDSWSVVVLRLVIQAPISVFATAAAAAMYLELVASTAPLTQSGYFLAPADSPS